jgi:tRNA-dihydrouridine synthase
MVEETGAAGVVVGRGCLGRPWLFRDLAAAFAPLVALRDGASAPPQEPEDALRPSRDPVTPVLPTLGEVRTMMRRHAELLSEHMGEERGCTEFRKHVAWYLKGFQAGGDLRHRLALVSSLPALDELLADLDPAEEFPIRELGTPRGRQGSPRRVVLPEGWLDDRAYAEDGVREDVESGSGG